MKIYTARQIKEWDKFTIDNESISSVDLMERAAQKCVQWIYSQNWATKRFKIFCGKGNNGGDGLAIARILAGNGYNVEVYILEFGHLGSDDFQVNLQRLQKLNGIIHFIQAVEKLPIIDRDDLVIDSLFGSGLNKPLEGLNAEIVDHINRSEATVVSIDVPSGLYIDRSSVGNKIIKADITLTFQVQKLAFLLPENMVYTGLIQILDIGLSPQFNTESNLQLLELPVIKKIYKPRPQFAHKGTFGHSLLIGGSYGKIGAIILSARSALRAGAGLVSIFAPSCGYNIIQTSVPEAMTMTTEGNHISDLGSLDFDKYNAIGIGPGLGTEIETQDVVYELVRKIRKPVVIDADALNCLSLKKDLLYNLPPNSILTPHPKEFERLFGKSGNDFERVQLAIEKANELNVIIILKGHHTFIAIPNNVSFFNNTGNPGMATGGTGDVLTGLLTSLIGQGYHPSEAALLGVYLHGLAGDIAAEKNSMESLIAGDLIDYFGSAYLKFQ